MDGAMSSLKLKESTIKTEYFHHLVEKIDIQVQITESVNGKINPSIRFTIWEGVWVLCHMSRPLITVLSVDFQDVQT